MRLTRPPSLGCRRDRGARCAARDRPRHGPGCVRHRPLRHRPAGGLVRDRLAHHGHRRGGRARPRGDLEHDVRRDGHAPTAPSSSSRSACSACSPAASRSCARAARPRPPAPACSRRPASCSPRPRTPPPSSPRSPPPPSPPSRTAARSTLTGAGPSAPRRSRAAAARGRAGARRVAGGAPPTSRSEIVMPLAARGVRLGALELGIERLGAGASAPRTARSPRSSPAAARSRSTTPSWSRRRAPPRASCYEAYGLLDAIFERAPVGLAVHDRDLRYVRINDRMAEINGLPAEEHIGRTVAEVVPDVDRRPGRPAPRARERRAADRARGRGHRPPRPGVEREWVVSYWPVRRRDDRRVSASARSSSTSPSGGAAERAVREQTARYESLLLALSQVGEAMVVAEAAAASSTRTPPSSRSAATAPGARALPSDLPHRRRGAAQGSRKRARMRIAGPAARGNRSRSATATAAGSRWRWPACRSTSGAAARWSWSPATSRRAPARRPSASGSCTAPPSWPRRAPPSTRSLDEEATLNALARLSVRELADTCVILLGGSAGAIRRVATVARDPGTRRGCRSSRSATRSPTAARTRCSRCSPPGSAARRAPRRCRHPARGRAPPRAGRGVHDPVHPARAAARPRAHARRDGARLQLAGGRRPPLRCPRISAGARALALDNARLYEERAQDRAHASGEPAAAAAARRSPGRRAGGALPRRRARATRSAATSTTSSTGERRLGARDRRRLRQGRRGRGRRRRWRATRCAPRRMHARRAAATCSRTLNEALLRQRADRRFCTVLYARARRRGRRRRGARARHRRPPAAAAAARRRRRSRRSGRRGTLLGIVPDPSSRRPSVRSRRATRSCSTPTA